MGGSLFRNREILDAPRSAHARAPSAGTALVPSPDNRALTIIDGKPYTAIDRARDKTRLEYWARIGTRSTIGIASSVVSVALGVLTGTSPVVFVSFLSILAMQVAGATSEIKEEKIRLRLTHDSEARRKRIQDAARDAIEAALDDGTASPEREIALDVTGEEPMRLRLNTITTDYMLSDCVSPDGDTRRVAAVQTVEGTVLRLAAAASAGEMEATITVAGIRSAMVYKNQTAGASSSETIMEVKHTRAIDCPAGLKDLVLNPVASPLPAPEVVSKASPERPVEKATVTDPADKTQADPGLIPFRGDAAPHFPPVAGDDRIRI